MLRSCRRRHRLCRLMSDRASLSILRWNRLVSHLSLFLGKNLALSQIGSFLLRLYFLILPSRRRSYLSSSLTLLLWLLLLISWRLIQGRSWCVVCRKNIFLFILGSWLNVLILSSLIGLLLGLLFLDKLGINLEPLGNEGYSIVFDGGFL